MKFKRFTKPQFLKSVGRELLGKLFGQFAEVLAAHKVKLPGMEADDLVQIKGNQPKLLQQAVALDGLQDTPFLPTPNPATDASKPGACTLSTSSRSEPTSLSPEP